MKISLDNQIKNTREAFDRAVPAFGHFERFEQKLEHRERRHTRQNRRWITASSIAAMFAILLVFQFSRTLTTVPDETESVAEVAGYYKLQLKEEISKIQKQLEKLDTPNRTEVINDLRSIMKDADETKIAETPLTAEEKISLIVRRYNAKIETLQHIHSIIENIPNKNNNL